MHLHCFAVNYERFVISVCNWPDTGDNFLFKMLFVLKLMSGECQEPETTHYKSVHVWTVCKSVFYFVAFSDLRVFLRLSQVRYVNYFVCSELCEGNKSCAG